MYDGWFCLGGTEIINNSRAEDFARSAPCGLNWFRGATCKGLKQALIDDGESYGSWLPDDPYDYTTEIMTSPWYQDWSNPALEFLGVYCLSVDGLDDDTIEAEVTERITGGGVIGRQRDASKSMRFRVVLTGLTARGLEYGRSWLANMLRETTCEMHPGGTCGTTSLRFFVACPDPFVNTGGGTWAYYNGVDNNTRVLHGVKCTTGLIKEQEFYRVSEATVTEVIRDEDPESPTYGAILNRPGWPDQGAFGGIYEFTLTAENPRMYSMPVIKELSVTGNYIIEDAPLNLVLTPSAELSSGTVEVARNYATNPSVETNVTGWVSQVVSISGSSATPYVSAPTTSTAQKLIGAQSARVRLLGNGSTAASGRTWLGGYQDVALGTAPVDARFSYTMWGYAQINAGAAASTIHSMQGRIEWRDGGGATLRSDTIGQITSSFGGHVFARASILPPLGAVTARCIIRADVTWASSATPANNSEIWLYVDALALTVP